VYVKARIRKIPFQVQVAGAGSHTAPRKPYLSLTALPNLSSSHVHLLDTDFDLNQLQPTSASISPNRRHHRQ
jgi:alpha-galactosidase/6-phospho-beta-glucosidase family protein